MSEVRTLEDIYDLILAQNQELKGTSALAMEVKTRIDTLTARVLAVLGTHERHEQRLDQLAGQLAEHKEAIETIRDEIVIIKTSIKLNRRGSK